jgi:indole-3-glycerol phosphate synthase
VDEFQILEARASAADAILLIAAGLNDAALKQLTAAAHAQQLDVLCEVHNAEELARVLELGCDAIGVNNRNLHTFEVRLETSLELASSLPSASVRIAESGIHTAADITRLRAAGFDAFLVGESLMHQPDPAQALLSLLSVPVAPAEVSA